MDCGSVRNLFRFNCLPNLMEWKDHAKNTINTIALVGKKVLQTCQRQPKIVIGSVIVVVVISAAFGTIKAICAAALPIILIATVIYKNSSKAKPNEGEKDSKKTNNKHPVNSETVSFILKKWTFFKTNLSKSKPSHSSFDPFVIACQELETNLKELLPILNEEDQKKIQGLIASAEEIKKNYQKEKNNSAFQEQLKALYKASEDACNQIYTHY